MTISPIAQRFKTLTAVVSEQVKTGTVLQATHTNSTTYERHDGDASVLTRYISTLDDNKTLDLREQELVTSLSASSM